jgi:aminoglycoside phosphotransferase (APT) family kinase protein
VSSHELEPGGGLDDGSRGMLLRGVPPAEALAWVSRVMGGVVEGCEVLRGAGSSAMHVVTIGNDDGRREDVVLRRYVLSAEREDRGIAAREAAALEVVAPVGVPTPRLLGCDPTGEQAGTPAVLMSLVDGRPVWEPRYRRSWCEQLVETLLLVHETVVPSDSLIGEYRLYAQVSYAPPRWAQRPALWERAVEIFHGEVPDGTMRFVHRDFHPGNVLWRRGRLTGVVDWQHACVGLPIVDVGHLRLNLFFADLDLADQFTQAWKRLTGDVYDPWADVVAIIGMLDNLRATPPNSRARTTIENALAVAAASLGP